MIMSKQMKFNRFVRCISLNHWIVLFMSLFLALSAQTVIAQTHIRESVIINGIKRSGRTTGRNGVSSITSGFVVPKSRGLRTSLQVLYSTETRRNSDTIPLRNRLWIDHADTNGHHTVFYDTIASRFGSPINYNPEVYDNCQQNFAYDNLYEFNPGLTNATDTVTNVIPRDTVVFAYLTQTLSPPATDISLGIWESSVDTLNGDTVGWSASFQQPNDCLSTPDENLEVFIGLNCTKYSRMSQGSMPWAPHRYIWAGTSASPITIRALGCALTCMAMIGQGMGLDVDPDTLNRFMRSQPIAPPDSLSVQWCALDNWQRQHLFHFHRKFGPGIRGARLPAPMNLGQVDSLLNMCYSVIAQVYHPRTGHGHWVLLIGKQSNGRYAILDPGVSDNPYLDNFIDPRDDYRNAIYQLAVYKAKEK